jgi:hypothetical protein
MEAKFSCMGVAAQVSGVEYVHSPITGMEHVAVANYTAMYENFFGIANEFKLHDAKSMGVLVRRDKHAGLKAEQLKDKSSCRALGYEDAIYVL